MNHLAALTDTEAVDRYPSLANLVLIRDAGWRFLPAEDEDGQPTELDAVRVWPEGWRDAIRVRSETDTLGMRFRLGDPREYVWEHTDTLAEVVHRLLAMPAPGRRQAPRLALGIAPGLWTP